MALSATLALSLASVQISQPTIATVVISNSGGSPVNLVNCQPTVIQHGGSPQSSWIPFAAGNMLDGLAGSIQVPASGSLTLLIPYVFFQPSSSTYDVSVNLTTSDGSFFSPSASQVTVTNVNFQDAT